MTWTTRLPPERTRAYGVEELHCAWLLPPGFPGRGPVVSLSIPECRLQFMPDIETGVLLWMFDRPRRPRRTVAHSIKAACKLATEEHAALMIITDTAEQLEPAVRLATRRLPHHPSGGAGAAVGERVRGPPGNREGAEDRRTCLRRDRPAGAFA